MIRFLYSASWLYQLGGIHSQGYISLASFFNLLCGVTHLVIYGHGDKAQDHVFSHPMRRFIATQLLCSIHVTSDPGCLGGWCSCLLYDTCWCDQEDSRRSPLLAPWWHSAAAQLYGGIHIEAHTAYLAQCYNTRRNRAILLYIWHFTELYLWRQE
ncbi:predicted protein [Lichtheimia corymbifera JMRC:FSU:9682]|uniref:Uncharacterized protein n=1 Tax=Lichtheimia corymbifera JMRC:FSU:9682 TaxID=1263082 RepID=A0A068SEI7_9FUNG|nr:predicted protein [Lichtheimia corymbifera JMRC:FSU:9682]